MSEIRKWVAGATLLALVVVAAGWFLLVSPRLAQASALRQQNVEQDSANARLRARISVLRAQERDLPEQEVRLAELREQIPDGVRLPELVNALTAAADQADVELLTLAPQPPAPLQPAVAPTAVAPAGAPSTGAPSTGAPVAGTAGAAAGPAQSGPLLQIPLTITVRGSYFQTEAFLQRLEELRRLVLVSGVTLTERSAAPAPGAAAGAAAGAVAKGSLEASITARTFLQGPPVAPPTAAAATSAPQGG